MQQIDEMQNDEKWNVRSSQKVLRIYESFSSLVEKSHEAAWENAKSVQRCIKTKGATLKNLKESALLWNEKTSDYATGT